MYFNKLCIFYRYSQQYQSLQKYETEQLALIDKLSNNET